MIQTLTSYFLMLIVLSGAVGINYDVHYCGGELVAQQLTIISSDLSCGMSKNNKTSVHESSDDSFGFSQVCCENDHYKFQITDDYKEVQSNTSTPPQFLLFIEIPELFSTLPQEKEYSFIGYSPPPLFYDIVLLTESFLI